MNLTNIFGATGFIVFFLFIGLLFGKNAGGIILVAALGFAWLFIRYEWFQGDQETAEYIKEKVKRAKEEKELKEALDKIQPLSTSAQTLWSDTDKEEGFSAIDEENEYKILSVEELKELAEEMEFEDSTYCSDAEHHDHNECFSGSLKSRLDKTMDDMRKKDNFLNNKEEKQSTKEKKNVSFVSKLFGNKDDRFKRE